MKAKTFSNKKARKTQFNQYQKIEQQQQPEPQLPAKKIKVNEDNLKFVNDASHENSQDSVINVDKDDDPPLSTTTISPSAFYPAFDPLHFFIDLRVSGYDRKKEAYLQQALKNNILFDANAHNILNNNNNNNSSSSSNNNNLIIGRNRANSAFKVPATSQMEQLQSFNAINLISSHHHQQQQQQQQQQQAFQKIYKRSDNDDENSNDTKNDEKIEIFDLDKSMDK
jgi:hypothetical protein